MIGFQSAATTTTSTTSASSAPNHQVSSLADATNNPMRAPSSHSPSPSSDSLTPISSPSLSSSSSTSGNHHLHNHHHQHLQLVDTSNMIQFKREKSSPPPLTMAGDDHHLRRNSPLANHISLINHHSHEQNHHNRHLHRHLHSQHLEHIKKAPPSPSTGGPVVSSPGYHSAASSPGSSISSPVSSSSGCSSAASTIGAGQQQVSSSSAAAAAAAAAVAVAAVAAVAANSSSLASSISPTSSTSSSRSTTTTTTTTTTTSSSSCPSAQLASTANLPNLLDYFPSANQDGLGLTWFHGANNRTRLTAGLMSNKMIIAGDISLAEMSRYPVPIMARPPLGVSDITLENWLQEVGQSQKGIKLTFTSTRTVEPAFRVLARHADQLRGPLVLNADVLARPALNFAGPGRQHQQEPQPVDAWTFLMLCRTRFPKSIISIGWCGSRASNSSNQSPINHLEHSVNNTTGVDCGPSLNFGTTGADSMFELDLVMEHQQGLSINQHLHLNAANHQHSSASRHQMGSLPLVSQLNGINHHHHRIAGMNHPNNNHHHLLSSNGSLNSSSGNSSGSPSPTSPVGHLMSSALHHNHHHHHQQQLNLHQGHPNYLNSHHRPGAMDSTEQLILAAAAAEQQQKGVNLASKPMGWPSLAAAAMMAVSMGSTPTSQTNQIHQHQQQQLPLNLNINEADPQHQAVALSDLAQKIQSLQQQHNLSSSSSSSSSQAPPSRSSIISHHLINNQHQWPHINKKAALSSRLNSDSPSPRLSSPKQFHGQSNNNSASGNLLCVKQTTPIKSTSSSMETNCDNSTTVGYTREMIDKMASLVKEYNLTQPVTFPVEARLLCRSSILSSNSNIVTTNNNSSLCELQRLLYQVGANSTLTIVAQQEDLIEVDDLLTIRKHFAANQILFDLPDKLANSLKQELDLL